MPWPPLPARTRRPARRTSAWCRRWARCGAVAAHDQHVVFEVLADLQHAFVFEQRLQRGERVASSGICVRRAGAVEVEAVAGGRCAAGRSRRGPAPAPARRRTDRRAWRRAVGFGVEGDEALLGRVGDPVVERGRGPSRFRRPERSNGMWRRPLCARRRASGAGASPPASRAGGLDSAAVRTIRRRRRRAGRAASTPSASAMRLVSVLNSICLQEREQRRRVGIARRPCRRAAVPPAHRPSAAPVRGEIRA